MTYTPAVPEVSASLDDPLARGVICRLLKMGFQRPDRAGLASVFSTSGREALKQAAACLEMGLEGTLTAAVESLCELPQPQLRELRRTYNQLFGHTLRGRVCPYECEYGRHPLLQQAHQLADLGGFYEAFGLRPTLGVGERVDHVSCELEFLEFLSIKEVMALQHEDREGREITQQAARRFLREHLARFGRAFARSLREEAPPGYYRILADICEAFLGVDCARLGVPLGPELLALRPEEADDAPMACGGGGDLLQIGGRPGPGAPNAE